MIDTTTKKALEYLTGHSDEKTIDAIVRNYVVLGLSTQGLHIDQFNENIVV